MAIGAGADGVFLINHQIGYGELIKAYHEVKDRFPSLWVGLNCLDLGLAAISSIPTKTQGLWVDDIGITDRGVEDRAKLFDSDRRKKAWSGLYFGSVAFKYQTIVHNLAEAALNAQPYVDVITTSGDKTGKSPTIEKVQVMKETIGDHPLAIASGMTPENVDEYMPYVDCFLVATGISKGFTTLCPDKALAFAKKLGK